MKKWQNNLLQISIWLIIFACIYFFVFTPSSPDDAKALKSHKHPVTNEGMYVLAIDMQKHGEHIGEQAILSGDAPILAHKVDIDDDIRSQILNGVKSLAEFDHNDDHWLEASDPNFEKLDLISLIRGGQYMKVIDLHKAGIKAIYISPSFLKAVHERALATLTTPAGHAIWADGSRWQIWVVKMTRKKLFSNI